jgi:hypothetical protein
MVEWDMTPILIAWEMASLFILGNVPGWPKVMALTWVLGEAPNEASSPAKSFVLVFNWACTSSPITASYFTTDAEAILPVFFAN